VASAGAPEFYQHLTRPSWAPPAWLFGPVWSLLYTMMGIAAGMIANRPADRRLRTVTALGLFAIQLAANALWSWLFFAWHRGVLAGTEIVVLWCLIAATLISFRRLRPVAAWLLIPYLAWVTFAGVLSWVIWRLNPALLGG
jgi:tryptophan-rich sensory protein